MIGLARRAVRFLAPLWVIFAILIAGVVLGLALHATSLAFSTVPSGGGGTSTAEPLWAAVQATAGGGNAAPPLSSSAVLNVPDQEAGSDQADGAGSDIPVSPAPSATFPASVALDLKAFASIPPRRLTFPGVRPIQESWYVGVASGRASHVGAGFPSSYLALPIGRGFRVRIVGPGGSVERVSTDAGPALHLQRRPENRVADLSRADFIHVCGVPASFGLCPVSISVLGRSKP